MVTFTCSNPPCEKKKKVWPYQLNSHGRNYCSVKCSAVHRRQGLNLGEEEVVSKEALKYFPRERHIKVNGKQITVPKGNPTPKEIANVCASIVKNRQTQKEKEKRLGARQPNYTSQEEKYYFIRKVSLSNVR